MLNSDTMMHLLTDTNMKNTLSAKKIILMVDITSGAVCSVHTIPGLHNRRPKLKKLL